MTHKQKFTLKKIIAGTVILGLVYVTARLVFGPIGQFNLALAKGFLEMGPKGWAIAALWFAPLWLPILLFAIYDLIQSRLRETYD